MNEYVQNNMKAMYNDNSEVNTNTIDVNQMIDSSNQGFSFHFGPSGQILL